PAVPTPTPSEAPQIARPAPPSVNPAPPAPTGVAPAPPAPPAPPAMPGVAPAPAPSAAPPAVPAPSSTEKVQIARSPRPTAEPSPEQAYQAAYQDFSKGHYALAIPGFRDFVRRFPDSPLADSAQYSIGESYFSMSRASATAGQSDKSKQELEQAVQE